MKKKISIFFFVLLIAIVSYFYINYRNKKKWEENYQNFPKNLIRVELLNGTKVDGLAFKMKNIMLHNGFDVISIDNAESDTFDKTILINRRHNNEMKMKILEYFLGVKNYISLYSDKAEEEKIDAVIILGKDIIENENFSGIKYLGGTLINENDQIDKRISGR